MQEFPERLRIFTSNAKSIREGNARIKEKEGEGAEVRPLPAPALQDCQAQSVMQGLPSPSITCGSRPFCRAHAQHPKSKVVLEAVLNDSQLLGLNLRSDRVLTSEMKCGGGERMDHYFHPPGHSEREAVLLKGVHARVPGHLRSTTPAGMELQSGGEGAPATCAAGSREAASKQRATQKLHSQDAGGERAHLLHCIALYKIRSMESMQERCTVLHIKCVDEDCADSLQLTAL